MQSGSEEQTWRQNFVKYSGVLRILILGIIAVLAFIVRIFSVIRYESVIHEFDPWFNYRATRYLAHNGFVEFWNWFDPMSWYPIGRHIGHSVFPGLMSTASVIYWLLHGIGIPVDIRNVCVFVAPLFASFTSLATYFFTKEITHKSAPALLSALFIAIVPSYMSRSVAGSYDNEGVAIFALVFTFYLYTKASQDGSILSAVFTCIAYFYMVISWGGYSFIIMFIPSYTIAMVMVNRFTHNMYIAYSIFYAMSNLIAPQISMAGLSPFYQNQYLPSHAAFLLVQAFMLKEIIAPLLSQEEFRKILRFLVLGAVLLFSAGFLFVMFTRSMNWQGRTLTILIPNFASKHIPIIASVSEHQATTWSGFYFDLQNLIVLMPLGLFYTLLDPTPPKIFIALYGAISVYTASVMIRLLLILAPAVCILAAIGASELASLFMITLQNFKLPCKRESGEIVSERAEEEEPNKPRSKKKKNQKTQNITESSGIVLKQKQNKNQGLSIEVSIAGLFILGLLLSSYIFHSSWTGSEAYSSPSIILASRQGGQRHIVDDFREAFQWLRENTPEDSRIMSWWDYGYQIAGMANRTVLVDNFTAHTRHIATVAKSFSSGEEQAYEIAKEMGAHYVLVVFGGLSHYSGDDINKFLWMIRIAQNDYPEIQEEDFLNNGSYRIDDAASQKLRESLMYKLCYYRFDQVYTMHGQPPGFDTVRGGVVGEKKIKLKYFEEVYSTERWLMRIYKLKDIKPEVKPISSAVDIKHNP